MTNVLKNFLEDELKEFTGMTWIEPKWLEYHDARLIKHVLDLVEKEVKGENGNVYNYHTVDDISTIINKLRV